MGLRSSSLEARLWEIPKESEKHMNNQVGSDTFQQKGLVLYLLPILLSYNTQISISLNTTCLKNILSYRKKSIANSFSGPEIITISASFQLMILLYSNTILYKLCFSNYRCCFELRFGIQKWEWKEIAYIEKVRKSFILSRKKKLISMGNVINLSPK